MKLEFVKKHLSIAAFPDVEIPPLTIIVGINGSGKTHLLQAIQNGSVKNSVSEVPLNQMLQPSESPVRLLSLGGSAINEATSYHSTENSFNSGNTIAQGQFNNLRRNVLAPFLNQLETLTKGTVTQSLKPGEDIWRLGVNELVSRSGDENCRLEIVRIFEAAKHELVKPRNPSIHHHQTGLDDQLRSSIRAVAIKLGISPLDVTEHQEQQLRPWKTDQFQNNLPTLFGRYRDASVRNSLAQLQDKRDQTAFSMTDEEFVAKFGDAPWKQISATFEAFNLPYEAMAPEMLGFGLVNLNLIKKPSGEPVNISDLSSGEKVLLQFAISSYQYDEAIVNVRRPAVLLLDEMDAPLHPEMVHRWLGVISSGLVDEQGMQCVITTHSPTTVALAPEASLFEMIDGFSGLTKISKQDALNKLTFGVPTLSIDYSGRRQVFTESDTDAAIYERIYSIIKSQIHCLRELNFISTGMRNKDGGEINSGCVVVSNVVHKLNEIGNMSVFGVVDWDGEAVSSGHVRVLAEGTHDGIENLLLDPLLICLLLLKERRPPAGLNNIDRFTGVEALKANEIQQLADAIQQRICPTNNGVQIEVFYLNGSSIKVFQDYLVMDDHILETAIRSNFEYLKKWSNRGALVMAVIDEVLTEYRGFCPTPLKTVFEGIANL